MTDYCGCGIPWHSNGNCERCGLEIEPSRLEKIIKTESSQTITSKAANKLMPQSSPSDVQLTDSQELVAAVNRTTHAVRAFVLFLFYQLTAATAAFVVYLLAVAVGRSSDACSEGLGYADACFPNSFLVVIALAIWIAGVIYSSNVGWSEIKKSAIPGS